MEQPVQGGRGRLADFAHGPWQFGLHGLAAAAAEAQASRGLVAVAVERGVLLEQGQQPLAVGVPGRRRVPERCEVTLGAGDPLVGLVGEGGAVAPLQPLVLAGRRFQREQAGIPFRPLYWGAATKRCSGSAAKKRRRGRELVLRHQRQADMLAIDGLDD